MRSYLVLNNRCWRLFFLINSNIENQKQTPILNHRNQKQDLEHLNLSADRHDL